MSFSQNNEEEFIINFFKQNKPKYKKFCDVGAYDGKKYSNTWALHMQGWVGILFEPEEKAFAELSRNYTGDKSSWLLNCAVSEQEEIDLWVPISEDGCIPATSTGILPAPDAEPQQWFRRKVKAEKLRDVVGEIDFLSIDAEGMDLEALKSARYENRGMFRPSLVMLEINKAACHVGIADPYMDSIGYERIFNNGLNAGYALKGLSA